MLDRCARRSGRAARVASSGAFFLLLTSFVSACASPTSGPVLSSCFEFQPIAPSPSDTAETQSAIALHNATWHKLCDPVIAIVR